MISSTFSVWLRGELSVPIPTNSHHPLLFGTNAKGTNSGLPLAVRPRSAAPRSAAPRFCSSDWPWKMLERSTAWRNGRNEKDAPWALEALASF